MKLVFTSRLSASGSCQRWVRVPLSWPPDGPFDATIDQYQVEVSPDPDTVALSLFDRVRARLFAYDIFPSQIIHSVICPSGGIAEGSTIVQRIMLGPVALEMAVRVIAVWDRESDGILEAGFTYATVVGHPECGTATFRVRLYDDGRVHVLIDARSRPGLLLTRLGRPVARTFQHGITRAALRRLMTTSRL